ncbi:hypothetical protein FLW53_09420 [Microbispora sp. SCL1-1]|uniref:hypothetical protein n=1 Tax=unclassified Microbispora TaxID=2614687 RepID=UPI001157574B|nr:MULTISPECIES: hypothetical protein [unclassified Microbispora]NJP24421.1 hypothetical protein [Microbispora sp. CL1-1]TQS14571.1 hypothetical protein FLW53_09420 [Microbispora sp. SCL1-1]
MAKFVIRTTDQAWINRNGGVDAGDGRIAVQVPEVEHLTICGKPWIRHRFADVPKDAPNGSLLCPAAWVA